MGCCQDGCNISILHNNKMRDVDDIDITADKATLPFSPVVNLKNVALSSVARWDIAMSPIVIDIDFPATYIDYFSLGQSNLSPDGTMTVEFWLAGVLQHTLSLAAPVIPIGVFNISIHEWLEKYQTSALLDDCIDGGINADNIKIHITDPTNPQTYIQLGRVFFGEMTCYPVQENMVLTHARNTNADGGACALSSGFSHINTAALGGRELDIPFDGVNMDLRASLFLAWRLFHDQPWVIKAGLPIESNSIINEHAFLGMPTIESVKHITYDKYSLDLNLKEI